MVSFEVFLGLFLLLIICGFLLKFNDFRFRKNALPHGTMGWPLLGETSEFLNQGPNFMKNQRSMYGNLFKTHILGSPTIISMDPKINQYILMNEAKGLVPGYPQSMLDILGKSNIAAVTGTLHKAMRSALLGLIGPAMLKNRVISQIDNFMRSHVGGFSGKVIDIQEITKKMWLLSALKLIFNVESGTLLEVLELEIDKLVTGTISLPVNVPGTNYNRGVKARKKIVSMLARLIEERRVLNKSTRNDMLDALLFNDDGTNSDLNDEQLIDLLITLVYSGYETVSTTSMMAIKYLHDNPNVLKELLKELLEIKQKKQPGDPIDWDDYKSMSFTRAVILETARLATIVNGVLRKTTNDMEFKGYKIPKGWKMYVYTRELNYDPFLYEDPLVFNPWRWLGKNNESHAYYTAFGGGSRACPGKEMGMAEISLFLYHFVTKYRWEEVGGEKLLKFPRVEAPNGLHIRVCDR